jgi:hypothetical protein
MQLAGELVVKYPFLKNSEFHFSYILSSVVFSLKENGNSELLLEEIVQFCSLLQATDEVMVQALLNALQLVYHRDASPRLFEFLKCQLTDKSNNVVRSEVCILLMSAYWNAENSMVPLEYFTALCEHSPDNCVMCHRGHMDSHLLRYLNQMKSSDYPELITASLKLVPIMAGIISSISVVCGFVSLLCSIKLTSRSRYHSHFIETLTTIATEV